MANKRILKKQIRNVCGSIASECILAMEFVDGVDIDAMTQIVGRIATLQATSLSNATFTFDKTRNEFENDRAYNKAKTAYNHAAFNSLKAHFNTEVKEIVTDLNALLPHA